MGTRSVIAASPATTGKGRYVHGDGYPTGVGAAIIAIVKRDGIDTARRVLTEEHFGWSSVDAEGDAKRETDGGRFVNVPGYGIAYSHDEHPDEWAQSVDSEEWGYVLADDALVITGHGSGSVSWSTDDEEAARILGTIEGSR